MILLDKDKTRASFGYWISTGRKEKDLKQSEVAERVGITQAHYSLIENGKREATMSLAINICGALDLNINDFIRSQSE